MYQLELPKSVLKASWFYFSKEKKDEFFNFLKKELNVIDIRELHKDFIITYQKSDVKYFKKLTEYSFYTIYNNKIVSLSDIVEFKNV